MIDSVVLPGSTIGIVGGGQLGRMLALEARRMDYRTLILDPDPAAPAGQVADDHIVAPLTDLEAAHELARRADVVTLEWENADLTAVRELARAVRVRPGPDVLAVAQNRLREKERANALGLPTAPFRAVSSEAELHLALADLGFPSVLKTVTGGYDGKGQWVLRGDSDVEEVISSGAVGEAEMILEGWVAFDSEISVICGRGNDGRVVTFPVVQNVHERGILDLTIAPAPLSAEVRQRAAAAAARLTTGLDVVGVLAVEMFVEPSGRVLVNEIAPRPHNSGHYTWEACSVSQFELQLRAVCGLPLEEPVLLRPAAMANLLGEHVGTGRGLPTLVDALALPMVSVHLYGKAVGRPGRKVGHITALADSAEDAAATALQARQLLSAGYSSTTVPLSPADTSG